VAQGDLIHAGYIYKQGVVMHFFDAPHFYIIHEWSSLYQ
jgi:hypothetical protein